MKPFSLYVHIPYCFHKCPYCDFNTYAVSLIPEREYISALLAELDYRASLDEWRGRPVQSIYFGGGTPSLLTPSSIKKIISFTCNTFPMQDDVEISLEANPGTVSLESLRGYRESGVNRLSIGAQSFHPETLRLLGRIHTPQHNEAAVEAARGAGFNNISLDLMFGAPKQTLADFRSDLREAVYLSPDHISAYGLTIEKGTEFYTSYKKGILKLPREKVVIEMTEELLSFLPTQGYQRYEISNYAQTGKEARHNLAYWNCNDYIGLGAGAHSYIDSHKPGSETYGMRWSNFASPKQYMEKATAHGDASAWKETLNRSGAIFEFFFLGLRKAQGITTSDFLQKFGCTVEEAYPGLVGVLVDQQLLTNSDGSIALTNRGLLLADTVIENFVPYGEEGLKEASATTEKAAEEEQKAETSEPNLLGVGNL